MIVLFHEQEEECLNRRDKLKEDVRHLIGKEKGFIEQLEFLDNLRQLGLSYHFELEIKDALKSINSREIINNELENNLHGTALFFRLLREHGFDASQLRWWKNLGIVCDELNFARDRLVEHYLWAMGYSFEPQFWRCRKGITKIACFITTIDDIYDVYGTLDELELFTEAVDKWEFSAIQLLPDYMKTCLTLLFNTMNEIANTTSAMQGSYVISCLKQSWSELCKAYLTEARWCHTGHTPTLKEYLENSWVSISGILPLVFAYCLSGDPTILEFVNAFKFYRETIRYSNIIFRLYNDMATSKDEIQRGNAPKFIQCYMKEKNVLESEARDYIKCLIMKYWKLLNHELATNPIYLDPFKSVIINIPRMAQCIFQNGDGHRDPNLDTRDRVISLLIEPIPL